MKKILLLLLLGLAGVLSWYFFVTRKKPKDETPKQQPVTVSQHSAAFNRSVSSFLNHYYSLSEALVKWDSAGVPAQAQAVQASLDKINFQELQKDTMIHETAVSYLDMLRTDLSRISGNQNLNAKRYAFHSFSQNLYDLLRTIKYDDAPVYLQQCPMAFNDEQPGIWISNQPVIRNPYLGLHHPKYHSGMLECGNTLDSLDFTRP